jgi:murein DD-endopeptidase MepM/ murein hydrolase activator NlpD
MLISNNHLCSPLPGMSLAELEAAIHNPFRPPRPGRDEPHQGVDIAVVQDGIAIPGEPVLSLLPGIVAAIIQDRFPYGFAMMIETPLESLDGELISNFQLPSSLPTREPHPALTCPPFDPTLNWDTRKRSLYLLYAHMRSMGNFQLEDSVECGRQLGEVGQSGNALNPHLHLEVRLGPAGARFPSMAHYLSDATQEEMSNYCDWRVRDIFLLVDPMHILSAIP